MEEPRVISKTLENIIAGFLVFLLVILPFAIGIGIAYYFIGRIIISSIVGVLATFVFLAMILD